MSNGLQKWRDCDLSLKQDYTNNEKVQKDYREIGEYYNDMNTSSKEYDDSRQKNHNCGEVNWNGNKFTMDI